MLRDKHEVEPQLLGQLDLLDALLEQLLPVADTRIGPLEEKT
jgi:hypothetical protein